MVGDVLLPGRLHLRLPDRTGRHGRSVPGVPEAGRGNLRRVHRHPLHAQGLARHLGDHRQDQVPDDRRPDRRHHPQLRRDDRGGRPRRARHLRHGPRRARIQIVEINAGGIGRDASELLRKIKAAQYVAAHPGEVCPGQVGRKATRRWRPRWTSSEKSDSRPDPNLPVPAIPGRDCSGKALRPKTLRLPSQCKPIDGDHHARRQHQDPARRLPRKAPAADRVGGHPPTAATPRAG